MRRQNSNMDTVIKELASGDQRERLMTTFAKA